MMSGGASEFGSLEVWKKEELGAVGRHRFIVAAKHAEPTQVVG
jgi:hypothetical protein